MLAVALLISFMALWPTTSSRSDDIVVVARKLDEWRAVLIVEQGGALRCKIVKSAGDAALNAKGCGAMEQCFVVTRPQFTAAQEKSLPTARRRRLLVEARQALSACFKDAKRRIAAEATEASHDR